jgi:hypothetical protein
MPDDRPTPAEIRALLAHLLAGAAGGTKSEWSARLGEIEILPIWLHPRCTWRVTPTGTKKQREAIDAAVAIVAEAHPYARPG